MQCPNCGQQRIASLKRCRNCGHTFTGAPVEAHVDEPVMPPAPQLTDIAAPTPDAAAVEQSRKAAEAARDAVEAATPSVPNTRYKCRPGYPHKESMDALRALYAAQDKAKQPFRLLAAFSLAGLFWWWFHSIPQMPWWAAILAAVLGYWIGIMVTLGNGYTITATTYYGFPNSQYKGEHRCIFCGHKGIWRRGRYRSDATFAHCSNCGSCLYSE